VAGQSGPTVSRMKRKQFTIWPRKKRFCLMSRHPHRQAAVAILPLYLSSSSASTPACASACALMPPGAAGRACENAWRKCDGEIEEARREAGCRPGEFEGASGQRGKGVRRGTPQGHASACWWRCVFMSCCGDEGVGYWGLKMALLSRVLPSSGLVLSCGLRCTADALPMHCDVLRAVQGAGEAGAG
jgi:hypothetical protein